MQAGAVDVVFVAIEPVRAAVIDFTAPYAEIAGTYAVPPGSANIVEFKLEVPGRFVLVDHALSRAEKGLAGYLIVEGDPNPEIFNAPPNDNASGH